MTRTEFFLKAMLQMAANPKYVEIKKENNDKGQPVTFPALDIEIVAIDAEALTREAEKAWNNPFDNEPEGESFTIGEHLQNITEKLSDIEEEMEREYDNEHDIK